MGDRQNEWRGLDDGGKTRLNAERLLAAALVFALSLFVASFGPPALVAAVTANLLFFAAIGAALRGAVVRERPFADHITAWDQAALLFLASLLSGAMVDPQAAEAVLAEMSKARGIS